MNILYEAEAAGCPGEFVEAHDDPLDIPALGEQFVDLLLCREEGQVPDIEG